MKRPVMLILIFDIVIVWNKLKFFGPQVINLLSRKQAIKVKLDVKNEI